jgi:hypothetical protein
MRGKALLSKPLTLKPSPLTLMRHRHGLTMNDAALKLGLSPLCIARIEGKTKRIPVCARRAMNAALTPPPLYVQLSLLDYIAEMKGGRA